jgi:hypothetical protein
MTDSDVTLCDVPAAHERDMVQQREMIHTLDLAGCGIVYIHKRMNAWEAEHPSIGHRFESWPDQVRHDIEREIEGWKTRNPKAVIKAITLGIEDGACNVALHWRPK